MKKNKIKNNRFNDDLIFSIVNHIGLIILVICFVYPLLYVLSSSFSSGDALVTGKVKFLPVELTLEGYKAVFAYKPIWTGYVNSIFYTITGTIISVSLTLFAAYPLSRDDIRGKKLWMFLFVFTMLFNGGLIPAYLMIKNLGLINTMWAVILPGAITAYNVIVASTFFKQTIPKEMLEASQIDGFSDWQFFARIAVPLSTPIIAVLSLWVAVGLWNSYFLPMIYLNSESKFTLQLVLRKILLLSKVDFSKATIDPELFAKNKYLSEVLKYGTIVVSSLPLMIMYPFVQKYFTKGVLVGSVKG